MPVPRLNAAILLGCVGTLQPCIAMAQAMTGWSDKQVAKRIESYAKLSPNAIARSVVVKDDDLESVAELSTENGFRFKGGFTDRVRADGFLRALIEKKSGGTVYQLYVKLAYTGPYRHFDALNTISSGGLISIRADLEHHDVSCEYGVCMSTDEIAFTLPTTLMTEIAPRASQPDQPMKYRLKAANGEDWNDDIPSAEFAGLMLAVEAHKAKYMR